MRCSFVTTRLTNIRLVALVHRVVVGDQRSLLSGLVVAQLARERLLVEMNNFVMDLQCFVGLELLAARLTHVNLKISANIITKCQLLHFAKLCKNGSKRKKRFSVTIFMK